MRTLILASVAVLLAAAPLASPSSAEDDPMEVQRCVWRCMEATGTKQPAYDRCIARQCDTGAPRKKTKRKKRR